MLTYEWRRYSAAVVMLALSAVLILSMFGMFIGIGKAFSASIDRSPADIIVMDPLSKRYYDNESGSLPSRVKPTLYLNPEVRLVSEVNDNGTMFRTRPPAGTPVKSSGVNISAIDVYPGALSLPSDYPESVRQALTVPFAIAIDESAQGRLGVKQGDTATMNGRTVKVAAILHGYPNMMDMQVVMSRDTLRMLGLAYPSTTSGRLLVGLFHPEKAEAVRDQLNKASDGKYRAWTRAELSKANETMVFAETIIVAIILVFVSVMGLIIGVIITALTLRGAILANLKELASLRALGISMGSLRLVMLELAFWVGLVGLTHSAALIYAVFTAANANGLPMAFTAPSVIGMAVLLMTVAMLSGVFSLGLLKRSQPADLLR